jgi:hypothetical protein
MVYILSVDGRNDDALGAFRRYRAYLDSMKASFPPSAHALAASDWYFDSADHRCPHDAWLEKLEVHEPSSGDRREMRALAITARLLGAYHDGQIELHYPRVLNYTLAAPSGDRGHGDWLYDELRVSGRGTLIHEIEWSGLPGAAGGRWLIEASDLEFRWIPRT